jgi:hypothetical protein
MNSSVEQGTWRTVKPWKNKFKPLENQTHAAIMTWLMKNISKRKNDSEAMLGWTCGPDSAKWPSTDLKDYEETVSLLNMLS